MRKALCIEMGKARPLLGPAALRGGADPNPPTTLLVVGGGIVIDHCRSPAVGEARRRIGQSDHDHWAGALRRRLPSSEPRCAR